MKLLFFLFSGRGGGEGGWPYLIEKKDRGKAGGRKLLLEKRRKAAYPKDFKGRQGKMAPGKCAFKI